MATKRPTPQPALVLADSHGVYIPQLWCADIAESDCDALHIRWSDVQTCQSGPDEEWYWEAWQSILDDCYMVEDCGTKWTLHQDGDLWEVPEGFSFEES